MGQSWRRRDLLSAVEISTLGPEPRKAGASKSWERQGTDSPQSLQGVGGGPSASTTVEPQEVPGRTSHPQNCERVTLFHLRALNLELFVTIARGN